MRALILIALFGCKDAPSTPTPGSADPQPSPSDDGMIGSVPATLGPTFSGIAWDKPARPGEAKRIAAQLGGVELELEPGPASLRAIEIKKTRGCTAFRARLARAWNAATNEAWLDPKAHVRASYVVNTDDDTCWLRFEPYVELAPWFAAIPLDAIGTKPEALAAKLGPEAIPGDGNIKWARPGVGFATVPTDMQANFDKEKGTIFELTATTQTDPATTAALVAVLVKRAGYAPTIEPDGKTTKRHWNKSKPQFVLFVTSDYLRNGTDFLTLFVD